MRTSSHRERIASSCAALQQRSSATCTSEPTFIDRCHLATFYRHFCVQFSTDVFVLECREIFLQMVAICVHVRARRELRRHRHTVRIKGMRGLDVRTSAATAASPPNPPGPRGRPAASRRAPPVYITKPPYRTYSDACTSADIVFVASHHTKPTVMVVRCCSLTADPQCPPPRHTTPHGLPQACPFICTHPSL